MGRPAAVAFCSIAGSKENAPGRIDRDADRGILPSGRCLPAALVHVAAKQGLCLQSRRLEKDGADYRQIVRKRNFVGYFSGEAGAAVVQITAEHALLDAIPIAFSRFRALIVKTPPDDDDSADDPWNVFLHASTPRS